ncbi:hypothetical protein BGZ47_009576 [Haplosporangium gracile]|nr:hypothetical protein BGZ47_009576 [Haplosporangium gracile]
MKIACVVGGFAHLPKDLNEEGKGKGKEKVTGAPDLVSTPVHDPVTDPPSDSSKPPFYNLAVKQKAVYQPVFRHRRWLENEKAVIPEGEEESVVNIETRLLSLKGQSASVINDVEQLEQVETRLKNFYARDDDRYKKHG